MGPYDNPPRLPDGESVDLGAFLPGPQPLELEIGPGRGSFILERCQSEPNLRIIAFEIRRKWATVVDRRLADKGYGDRARVLCEDARVALPRLMPSGSVARIFVHFPDPWWKKRHQKRLVVVDPLLDQVTRLLAPDGELFIQTDVPERADEYEARVTGHALLSPHGDGPGSARIANSPYEAKSNREHHADRDGLPVYRLRYQKRATSSSES